MISLGLKVLGSVLFRKKEMEPRLEKSPTAKFPSFSFDEPHVDTKRSEHKPKEVKVVITFSHKKISTYSLCKATKTLPAIESKKLVKASFWSVDPVIRLTRDQIFDSEIVMFSESTKKVRRSEYKKDANLFSRIYEDNHEHDSFCLLVKVEDTRKVSYDYYLFDQIARSIKGYHGVYFVSASNSRSYRHINDDKIHFC